MAPDSDSDPNSVLTPEQAQFLTDNNIAAFATGRNHGSRLPTRLPGLESAPGCPVRI